MGDFSKCHAPLGPEPDLKELTSKERSELIKEERFAEIKARDLYTAETKRDRLNQKIANKEARITDFDQKIANKDARIKGMEEYLEFGKTYWEKEDKRYKKSTA